MTPSKSIVHTLLSKWIFAIRNARQKGISTNLLIGLVTFWLLLFANAELWNVLWKLVFKTDEVNWQLAASLPVIVFAWVFTVLSLLSWGRLAKPILCLVLIQCHQPKLQPCPRQAPRSSQPPWPSGDDQASAAQSGGLAGLAVM